MSVLGIIYALVTVIAWGTHEYSGGCDYRNGWCRTSRKC